ncbi:hypothetical protein [Puia sp.]|jgi:hypothetical protein|uniref:gliding motility protein GldB-related protein n=1 Tax=Puia sp. TaxID=2045100 RepID=UPI002F422424
MRSFALFLAVSIVFVSCGSADKPDVSGVDVGKVHIERFDTAFFNIDSNDIISGLRRLDREYPWFTPDFVENILGAAEPLTDTSRIAFAATRQFLITYLGVSDSLKQKYPRLDWLESELQRGFRFVKYYFPQYKLPQRAVAFVGPFDGPGVAITSNALAIGLQSYAGRNFPFYLTGKGQDLYPQYVSRRFEPEYITANCLNAIAQDIFPDSSDGRPLIDEMIIKGRYLWLAGKLSPDLPDSIRTGYTKAQLDWCAGNEAAVWNFFLQGTDLYTQDPDIIKNYIGEGPKTLGMPDAAPGNIGAWVGWQIVRKYASAHKDLTPAQMMTLPVRSLFEAAKYKPK